MEEGLEAGGRSAGTSLGACGLGQFDDDLVGAHQAHFVVETFGGTVGVALDAKQWVEVGDLTEIFQRQREGHLLLSNLPLQARSSGVSSSIRVFEFSSVFLLNSSWGCVATSQRSVIAQKLPPGGT